MGMFDSITGGAAKTAYKNNIATIGVGENQANQVLGDNYANANSILGNYALPALGAGYGSARTDVVNQVGNAVDSLGAGYGSGRDALNDLYGQATGAINAGASNALNSLGQGRTDLTNQYGIARGDITTNFDRARSDLGNAYNQTQGYLGGITSSYQPLISQTAGSVSRLANATGANGAAGSEQAAADFREAPGYTYARDQALGAVQRSAAARGGLAGGNATADILKTANGLADQGYQTYIQNLQGVTGLYTQGLQGQAQGLALQGNASQHYGDALSQLGQGQGAALAGISTGLGDRLAANDSSAASIYGNQGSALAGLYGSQANALNASHVGEGTALSGLYGNFGSSLGTLDTGLGSGQANIYGQQAGNLTQLGNAESGVIQNATKMFVDNSNNEAKAQTAAGGNFLGMLGGIASSPLTGNILSGIGKMFG